MMGSYLEFEKPIEELEMKIEELRRTSDGMDINLDGKVKDLRTDIFSKLTPWQKTLLARHPDRPYTLDYIPLIAEEFIELHGDRRFADDKAIVGGLALIKGTPVVLIGQQKGRGTKERIQRNFGQPHPEEYRKAMKLMELGEKFK